MLPGIHRKEELIMKVQRGDIFIADLTSTIGSEQGGIRPVLILQNNTGNKHSPTTIVASITGRIDTKTHIPTHYYLPASVGLKMHSMVMLEQIRVIDKQRLHKKIGKLPERFMKMIDKKIEVSLGIKTRTVKEHYR